MANPRRSGGRQRRVARAHRQGVRQLGRVHPAFVAADEGLLRFMGAAASVGITVGSGRVVAELEEDDDTSTDYFSAEELDEMSY